MTFCFLPAHGAFWKWVWEDELSPVREADRPERCHVGAVPPHLPGLQLCLPPGRTPGLLWAGCRRGGLPLARRPPAGQARPGCDGPLSLRLRPEAELRGRARRGP